MMGPARSGEARRARRRRTFLRAGACVAIASALTGLAWVGLANGWLGGFQERASDAVHPRGHTAEEVLVLGVDAASLIEMDEPWPWPRDRWADVIAALDEAGAAVVVLDVVLAPAASGDADIAAAMTDVPVVLAEAVEVGGVDDRGVLQAAVVSRPSGLLVDAAAAVGHTAVTPDAGDGVVRHVPLVVERDLRYDPALAIAALAVADGVPPDVVVRPEALQVGHTVVPTDGFHRMRVSWAPQLVDAGSPRILPVVDLLAGRVGDGELAGATVFVGLTDPTLGDRQLTPVARQGGAPGVLVHAAAYNTIRSSAYLEPVDDWVALTLVFALALIVAISVQFLPVPVGAAVSLGVAVGSVLLVLLPFADGGDLVDPVYPVVAVALAVPLSGGVRYGLESRRRRKVYGLFAQYVPAAVAEELVEVADLHKVMSGQRVTVSVLFCDLRGFTAMSARTAPTSVNHMLELYYEFASQRVLDTGGTLMQYVGDEVFAVFGAPVASDDHVSLALLCARRMQEEVAELDELLASAQFESLRFGIGVHCGEVVAAHSGSSVRRQYTVIGDAVNVGSRLCSQAGPGQVVLSDDVRCASGDQRVEAMGPLEMKGVRADFVAWKLVLDPEPPGSADR